MNKTSKNLEYMRKQDRRNMIRSEFDPKFAAIRTAFPRGKVHILEGHKILRNLHLTFDWHCV